MKNFNPTVFITKGDEKISSALLKEKALAYAKIDGIIKYTDNGKPYIKNAGISVTHDENLTAVIITPFEHVGIDIEKVKDTYPERVADRFFTDKERINIKTPSDFYKIWCKKESYVKMTGEGIAGIREFNTFSNRLIFTDLSDKISELTGENFVLIICSKEKFTPEIITVQSAF